MQWLVTNWFWLLIGVGFIAMHLFGHGAHRGPVGHTGHGGGDRPRRDNQGETDDPPTAGVNRIAGGHQH